MKKLKVLFKNFIQLQKKSFFNAESAKKAEINAEERIYKNIFHNFEVTGEGKFKKNR